MTGNGKMMDVTVTAVTAFVFTLLMFYFAWTYKGGELLQILILSGTFGATLGWLAGVMATPYSVKEEQRLSRISTVIYGFLSGYALSKLDTLLTSMLFRPESADFKTNWVLVTIFLTSGVISFLVTYTNRSYWLGLAGKPPLKSEKVSTDDE